MNTPTPITQQHRALWTTLYNLAHDEIFDVASSDGPAHQLIADSEARAVAALTIERDQLRAQLHALNLICGTNDANKFETWVDRANARADKAEDELATERARLDWLESDAGVDWQWSSSALTIRRAAIDAAMKRGAK